MTSREPHHAPGPWVRRWRNWIGPLASLLVIGALVGGAYLFSPGGAQVGDCLRVDETDTESPYSFGDCADPATTFTVLQLVTEQGPDCRRVPGAVRSTTQFATDETWELCLGEKGVDPSTTINVAQRGDCLTGGSGPLRRVACDDPTAAFTILERVDNVSELDEPTACDGVPSATTSYSWDWEQESGPLAGFDPAIDAVFCLVGR